MKQIVLIITAITITATVIILVLFAYNKDQGVAAMSAAVIALEKWGRQEYLQ